MGPAVTTPPKSDPTRVDSPVKKPEVNVSVQEIQPKAAPNQQKMPAPTTAPSTAPSSAPTTAPAKPITAAVVPKLNTTDRLLFRLNKLLAPSRDLGSILTTTNYTLYLLAYFDNETKPYRTAALSFFRRDAVKTTAKVVEAFPFKNAHTSRFARLGHVVSDARATLRLFGLLPLYVEMRQLMNSPKDMDSLLKTIRMVKCFFYTVFQLLENVAFLTEKRVLSRRLTAHARTSTLYKLAHRAWFMAIITEMVRLVREAQVFMVKTYQKGGPSEEDLNKASQRYFDWIYPLAWLPIGWRLSNWTENGNTELHLGLHGFAGMLADLKRTVTLWNQTQAV